MLFYKIGAIGILIWSMASAYLALYHPIDFEYFHSFSERTQHFTSVSKENHESRTNEAIVKKKKENHFYSFEKSPKMDFLLREFLKACRELKYEECSILGDQLLEFDNESNWESQNWCKSFF
jgi:hypothetical protein